MPSLKIASLCLLAALATTTNAFTVAPPASGRVSNTQLFAIDVPAAPANQVNNVVSSAVMTTVQTSSSNLPSQKELLEKVGSITLASSSAAPKSVNVAAGSGISIADIHFDGVVPKTESDEYVIISNSSRDPVDVSGYYIYVATTGTQGPTFYFPKGSVIKGGSSVRLYTNEIHKESGGYSYGSGKALWSNNGGLGVLKDGNGKKLGEYKYKPVKIKSA
jgi:hypothetical protein